ncbi:unnamed protein product, partial [Scytosiphon promiscuus]
MDSAGPVMETPAVTAAATPATAGGAPAAATAVAGGQPSADGNHEHMTVGMGFSGATPAVPVAGSEGIKSDSAVAGGGAGNSGSVPVGDEVKESKTTTSNSASARARTEGAAVTAAKLAGDAKGTGHPLSASSIASVAADSDGNVVIGGVTGHVGKDR